MLKQVLDRAVIANQLYGGFLAYSPGAGNIVGSIACKGEHVRQLCRQQPVFFFNFLSIVDKISAFVVYAYALINKLERILVGSYYYNVNRIARRLARQRRYEIVSLKALFFYECDI